MGENNFDELNLPAEFLTDDIIFSDKENFNRNGELAFLNSTTESVTESEDFLTRLNRRFALSTLQETPKIAPEKACAMSTSPQSILSPVFVSGSSNRRSPAVTNIGSCWEVKKMSNQGAIKIQGPPYFSQFVSSNPVTSLHTTYNGSIWGNQPQPVYNNRESAAFGGLGSGGCDLMRETDWPLPQDRKPKQYRNQPPCSGGVEMMTAVYGGGLKRECGGTGVFLPRRYTPESRKKSGSVAQLPPRVVKSRNKDLKKTTPQLQGSSSAHFVGSHVSETETLTARRNAILAQEWRNYRMTAAERALSNETRLPHEWTY